MKAKSIKIINLIVAVLIALFAIGQAFAWFIDGKRSLWKGFGGSSAGAYFAYGDGSEADPFGINTKYHLYNLAWLQNTGRLKNSDGTAIKYHFELDPDMDAPLNMDDMWLPPIGNDDNPFTGEFDGNGKTVANVKITTDKNKLTANPASESYEFSNAVGMFGMTTKDSEVANFVLANPIVEAASANTKYATEWDGTETDTHSKRVIGLAVGHVAGKCSSIGVRATEAGAQNTQLMVNKIGYSTFNSILGELANGVTSSVTGGGHAMGSGGSGNAFGASFDVDTLATRLIAMKDNKGASPYLPKIDTQSSIPVPALGYKVPFAVDSSKSNYTGATAREYIADDNIGYDMGNQNKISAKKINYTDNLMKDDGTGTYYITDSAGNKSTPDNNHIPRWFYVRDNLWGNGGYVARDGFAPISQQKYNALPNNVKKLLTEENHSVMRIQAGYTQYTTAPIEVNNRNALTWGYHGQISWMGKTYGKGFADSNGYAIDENGNYYTASGNLMGEDGYDINEDGSYGVDLSSNPGFPYIVYGVQAGATWNSAYALDENNNYYYRYNPKDSGYYKYGILDGGYMRTGDDYSYYVSPIAGWTAPITLIDENGYAMYADGIYYDASGHLVDGAYVKDNNGFYIAADTAFKMPISQIVNGYAQDADGNYYGKITLNEKTVYCYLGADGKPSGYDGWYMINGNDFLVKANNVDGEGYIKYNDTDYYGTYDGKSGYIDANGYFYGDNHAYTVNDANFRFVVTVADGNGNAMTSDGAYYGKYSYTKNYVDQTDYGYLDGTYFYMITDGKKVYAVNDTNFTDTVNSIDENGNAKNVDGVYYGRYRNTDWNPYVYGVLENRNGTNYLKVNGKYVATNGNYYDNIADDGRIMYDSDQYYGYFNNALVKLSNDGCVYDETLDGKGNPRAYAFYDGYWWFNNAGYEACTDIESDNYGYYVKKDTGEVFENYFATGADKRLKAWGLTAEEVSEIMSVGKVGIAENNYFDPHNYAIATSSDFLHAVEGETVKVETGEAIKVEAGEKSKAISSDEINALDGEFITPKEIEKVAVVKEGDNDISAVTVMQGSKVQLYAFNSGVALPNNGLWFKPSQAGVFRFVMFAQQSNEAFCLLKCTRTNATEANPFYTNGSDISVEKVLQQQLPPYVLFYFEYEVKAEEIYNTEFIIMVDNNVKEEGSDKETDYKGAYFLYLDIGSSAAEDTSGIDRDKDVSAIDFIYDVVDISQSDLTGGILKGDFIVTPSGGASVRYESSKTSVYFEEIKSVLNIVFVRLYGQQDGKTIKVTVASSEVTATNTGLVTGLIIG